MIFIWPSKAFSQRKIVEVEILNLFASTFLSTPAFTCIILILPHPGFLFFTQSRIFDSVIYDSFFGMEKSALKLT